MPVSLLGRCLVLFLALLLSACTALPPVQPEPDHFQVSPGAEGRRFRTNDNLTLFGQWWTPPGEPRAVVLLVHGTGQHSGFYGPWVAQLMEHGYATFGLDLRGWGQSQGYGRRGYVRNYDEYVEDLALAWREARRRYPEVPIYLQGDSLGGDVALLAHITNRFEVDGLILHAPAVQPNPGLGWLRVGGISVSTVATVGKLAPNAPLLPIMSAFAHLAFFDESARRRFQDDPLCTHDALPAAYLAAMDDVAVRLRQNLVNVQAPLLVIHGSRDTLVPVSSSELLMRQAGSSDKTLKVYEGGAHASLSDADRERVWADVIAWLDARTEKMRVPEEGVATVAWRD